MSDLSKHLRSIGNECVALGYASLRHNYFEAANELDRLNAQALELCAEISGLRREREDFHMDYRMKCDEETKRLHVDNERLRGLLREACGNMAWRPSIKPLIARIDAALAGAADQPDAVLRDAERYRYMRNNASFRDRNGPGLYWYLPRFLPGGGAEQLDAAIDAELRRTADPTKAAP